MLCRYLRNSLLPTIIFGIGIEQRSYQVIYWFNVMWSFITIFMVLENTF